MYFGACNCVFIDKFSYLVDGGAWTLVSKRANRKVVRTTPASGKKPLMFRQSARGYL
jgi:hypothetical protein